MSAMGLSKMIYSYSGERLCKADSLRQALNLEDDSLRGRRPVVSAVGAGGKTTTLHRLAEEYVQAGIPAVVTTTTHIMKEDSPWFLSDVSAEQIKGALGRFGQVWIGTSVPGGKLGILPEALLEEIAGWDVPLLIEADGARRMPLKVPADHEPVILPCTTHVLSVYGLDSVGKKIEDTVFRPELAEILLEKKRTDCVAPEDIALLAASELAGRKGCAAGMEYTVVLNKADHEGLMETALEICRALRSGGLSRVVVTGRSGDEAREADREK